jgi:hypothetical protein
MVHGGAQGYGAPPSATPMTVLPTPPTVAPTPAPAVFELARQPLRPDGRRSHAPWSVDIRIDADGAWTARGRSGRLSPTQLAELRAAIERTSLSVSQSSPLGATSEAGETGRRFQTRRVTLGSRSVSWSELVPDDSIDRLIALARRLTRSRP